MNLVCYPHYAAGGLICNILNQPPQSGSHISATVSSLEHVLFIGDNWTVYDDFGPAEFEKKRLEVLKTYSPNKPWLGTHCHPKLIDLSNFNKTISITTDSIQSQLYRWLRAYNLYFKPQWVKYAGMERVDLMRETAKSYLTPFYHCEKNGLVEIELSDIVNKTPKFVKLCNSMTNDPDFGKVDVWLEHNNFLLDHINTAEYNSFLEAEYEISTNQLYEYQ